MTKEAVQQLWNNNAAEVIKARKITGGTTDKGWNQDVCGLITFITVQDIQANDDLKSDDQKMACIAACTFGSNCSARGQALFSAKTQKATALHNEYLSLVR